MYKNDVIPCACASRGSTCAVCVVVRTLLQIGEHSSCLGRRDEIRVISNLGLFSRPPYIRRPDAVRTLPASVGREREREREREGEV